MEDLPRAERLRGRDSISRLFAEGNTGASGGILVRALPGDAGIRRMAAVAGKKLGNAVARNRMKRRLRAAYRQEKESLPEGWEFALVARRGLLESEWRDVIQDLRKAVARAVRDTGRTGPQRPPLQR